LSHKPRLSRDHRNHPRVYRLVRDRLLHFHFRALGPGVAVGGGPHPPAIPCTGKVALAGGGEPVERNRLPEAAIFSGHVDVGNAAYRGSKSRTLVLVLESHI